MNSDNLRPALEPYKVDAFQLHNGRSVMIPLRWDERVNEWVLTEEAHWIIERAKSAPVGGQVAYVPLRHGEKIADGDVYFHLGGPHIMPVESVGEYWYSSRPVQIFRPITIPQSEDPATKAAEMMAWLKTQDTEPRDRNQPAPVGDERAALSLEALQAAFEEWSQQSDYPLDLTMWPGPTDSYRQPRTQSRFDVWCVAAEWAFKQARAALDRSGGSDRMRAALETLREQEYTLQFDDGDVHISDFCQRALEPLPPPPAGDEITVTDEEIRAAIEGAKSMPHDPERLARIQARLREGGAA